MRGRGPVTHGANRKHEFVVRSPWRDGSGSAAVGQHDRNFARRGPLDEFKSKLAARTASETDAKLIGYLLGGIPRSRDQLTRRVDELAVGYSVAKTDIHAMVCRNG